MINDNTISLNNKLYDIVLTFKTENNREYIIYKEQNEDEDGFYKTYAGIYESDGKKDTLIPIQSDEEWEVIENLLQRLDIKSKE